MNKRIRDRQHELLLKEYELCQKAINDIETPIWNLSTILTAASIGSLAILADKDIPWYVVFFIGYFGSLIVWIWWFSARRRWDIQHTKLMRMRHIEESLHVFQNLYVSFRDQSLHWRSDPIQRGKNITDKQYKELCFYNDFEDISKAIKKTKTEWNRFARKGVKKWIGLLPLLNTLLWASYIAYSIYRDCDDSLLCFSQLMHRDYIFSLFMIILVIITIIGLLLYYFFFPFDTIKRMKAIQKKIDELYK